MDITKKILVDGFRSYCSKCNGLCCRTAEFTVFGRELSKLPKAKYPLIFRKQWGSRGKSEDIDIERISMGKECPYLKKTGCILYPQKRPLDCISYPIYPIIKYNRTDNMKIVGMMVHRSCTFSAKFLRTKNLLDKFSNFGKKSYQVLVKKTLGIGLAIKEIIGWIKI